MKLFGVDTSKSKLTKVEKLIYFLLTLYMSSIFAFSHNVSMMRYSQIIFIVAFGVCASYLAVKHVRFRREPLFYFMILFIMFCVFTLLWTRNRVATSTKIFTLLQLMVMAWCIYSFVIYSKGVNAIIFSIFASGIIGSIYILSVYGIDGYMKLLETGTRAGQEITNVNVIGVHMATTAIIGFYYGFIKRKPIAYFFIILPVIMALGTGSKKALIMIVIGIVMVVLLGSKDKMSVKSFFRLAIVVTILVGVFLWITTLPLFNVAFTRFFRMLGINGEQQDSSTIHRMRMIEIGWEYFKEHPFSGIGPGNTGYITAQYLGKNTYLHNNYIELLASVGLIGTFIYYAMYFYLIKNMIILFRKEKNTEMLLLLIILLLQVVIEFAMVSYYDKMTYIYIAVMAATIYIEKEVKSIESNSA